MSFRNVVKAQQAHIKSLYAIVGVSWFVLIFNALGWMAATRELPPIDIPPDLTQRVTVRPGDYHKPTIYSFAQGIWQGVNRWKKNGHKEYAQNLYRFSPYLTPAFFADREADLKERARRGELSNRARALQPIPGREYGPDKVKALKDDTWIVYLDLDLQEWHGGTTVKDTPIHYPLRVVVFDVDRDQNQWGLALDGFDGDGYRRIDETKLAQRGNAHETP